MTGYKSYPIAYQGRVVEGGRVSLWVNGGDIAKIQTKHKDLYGDTPTTIILCPRLPDSNRKALEDEAFKLGVKILYQSGTAGWEILVPMGKDEAENKAEYSYGSEIKVDSDSFNSTTHEGTSMQVKDNDTNLHSPDNVLVDNNDLPTTEQPAMTLPSSLPAMTHSTPPPTMTYPPTEKRGRPKIQVLDDIIQRIDEELQSGKSASKIHESFKSEGLRVPMRIIRERGKK